MYCYCSLSEGVPHCFMCFGHVCCCLGMLLVRYRVWMVSCSLILLEISCSDLELCFMMSCASRAVELETLTYFEMTGVLCSC